METWVIETFRRALIATVCLAGGALLFCMAMPISLVMSPLALVTGMGAYAARYVIQPTRTHLDKKRKIARRGM